MFVVTGGGRGLGRALALALAARRHAVLIVGRDESALSEVAALDVHIEYLVADLATIAGRLQLLLRLDSVQQLSGMVHNAGVIEPILPMLEMDDAAWRHVMAVNLDAPRFLNQKLHHKLSQARVLHIGSGAAYFPVAGWSAYCVSKAALAMLSRCCQLEWPEMAVTSVMPGIIDTLMQEQIRNTTHMAHDKQEFFKQLKDHNQLLKPETVAEFLCWLLLTIDSTRYVSKEWDIYDVTHHAEWLLPLHVVPVL